MATSTIKKKHTGYRAAINIRAYDSESNKYTFPTDGIVLVEGYWEAGAYILGNVCDVWGYTIFSINVGGSTSTNTSTNSSSAVPVFAGMKAYCQSNNANTGFCFIPYA